MEYEDDDDGDGRTIVRLLLMSADDGDEHNDAGDLITLKVGSRPTITFAAINVR